jgi:prepilin-type N-terminal cleavage/methylation domain-containing protein
MKKAFSLVELMIVVAIIGILAAMVIPKVQDYSAQAREAAAKENLMTLRSAIELYASQHNGIPPGYPNNNVMATPDTLNFVLQLVKTTNASGTVGDKGTPGFIYGPYLSKFPNNPFNNNGYVRMVANGAAFPSATGKFGYYYQPSTKTIRLDKPGNDTKGKPFSEY